MKSSMIGAAACLMISTALADEPNLIGQWPLINNAKDTSGNNRHGTAQAVEFAATGAAFNGRSSRIDVADAPQLGTGDFSISLWVQRVTKGSHKRCQRRVSDRLFECRKTG